MEASYRALAQELIGFFSSSQSSKEQCTGSIYRNERGIPMWHSGYERCGEMREAFRVHAGLPDAQVWGESSNLQRRWMQLLHMCEQICNRALSLTLGYKVEAPVDRAADDFSVCYALHYPNDTSRYSAELNVTEHVDPSLYVIEPCCGVAGLEVLDTHSNQWIPVEAVCREGKDLILFGGKALQAATEGAIKGTLHRVRRGPNSRYCFIYEQKYEQFFDAPSLD